MSIHWWLASYMIVDGQGHSKNDTPFLKMIYFIYHSMADRKLVNSIGEPICNHET